MKTVTHMFRKQIAQQNQRSLSTVLLADDIEAALDANSSHVVLSHRNEHITALDLERRASIFARWALRRDFQAGDQIAVALSPAVDYVALWIGLSKIGVCACLIPTDLNIKAMIECASTCQARAVIADPMLADRWRAQITENTEIYALAEDDTKGDIGPGIEKLPDFRPDREHREDLTPQSPALILFTSGANGAIRPVTLDQTMVIAMMRALGRPAGLRRGKRILSMLPLYHHLAGLCGVGAAIHCGATLVLGPQFSADRFWQHARESSATGFLHSGEMCRHLMIASPDKSEKRHNMTEAIGAGMSSALATALARRAGIRKLIEVYTTSDALVVMVGPGGQTGAIGRPVAFPQVRPEMRLARLDPVSGACARDDTGCCIEVGSDETGEALVSISAVRKDARDSILVDAFAPGDIWQRTGDMMRRVGNGGGYRFVGRRDQVWQWREHTVFAQMIEEALLKFAGIAHVCAYGVSIPGQRGTAAMACIVPSGRSLDLTGLGKHMNTVLSPAEIPRFVRLRSEPLLGPTFFHQRARLASAGFDPSATSDPLYVNNLGTLGRLDETVYAKICSYPALSA